MAVSNAALVWLGGVAGMSLALLGLGLGWNVSYVAATTELVSLTAPVRARAASSASPTSARASSRPGSPSLGGLVYSGAGVTALALSAAALAAIPAPLARRPAADGPLPLLAFATIPRRRTPVRLFSVMKTYTAKPGEITREWYLVDADGQTLGRLATLIADTLARQAEAAVHPARRHRRLRDRRERREDPRDGQQARPEDVLPALGLPGRAQEPDAARAARPAPDRGSPRGGEGHAPEEPARAAAAHEAQDLRRARASARPAKPEALLEQ